MKAIVTDPENSGKTVVGITQCGWWLVQHSVWYKTILNSKGVSFNASKDFYHNIQQTIKQDTDNQTRINNT
jgi:hypothetical protein